MEDIEQRCLAFVKHCTTAYSYKKQSLVNEHQLRTIVASLTHIECIQPSKGKTETNKLLQSIQKMMERITAQKSVYTINKASLIEILTRLSSCLTRDDSNCEDIYQIYSIIDSLSEVSNYNGQQNSTLNKEDTVDDIEYILPVSTFEDMQYLLPKHTVFDAIPLNKDNIALLCTPLLQAEQWQYIEEDLAGIILTLLRNLTDRKQSITWILE